MSARTGIIAVLALAALMRFGPWPLLIGVAIVVEYLAIEQLTDDRTARRAELAAEHARLNAQADQQMAWQLKGDPRGTYGDPEDLT